MRPGGVLSRANGLKNPSPERASETSGEDVGSGPPSGRVRSGRVGSGDESLTSGADAHTPKTAAQILCLAACEVLPAIMAAFALAGGAPTSTSGSVAKISNSLCSVAVPASGRTSAARPSASSSLDICDTPTGVFRSTASTCVSIVSSAGATACAAATSKFSPPSGSACITGSTNDTAPSNAAPMPSSTADRPSGVVAAAFAGSNAAPGASIAITPATCDAAAAAAARGSSAVHSLAHSINLARSITHASRSSSRDSNSHSQSSPLAPGTARESSAEATPPPCCNHPRTVSRSATTAPGGSRKPPSGGVAPAPCCCAPKTPDPDPFSGRTNVPGSSAPMPRSRPGQEGMAAERTSRLGYLVSPRSASRNAERSASSGTTLT